VNLAAVRGASLVAVVVVLNVLLSACGTNAPPVTEAERKALQAEAAAPPRLHPGEKIHITVYGEPSLTGDYQIDPSGLVSLPLAGTVKAAGLNQQELEQELTAKYRGGYLKDPKITVSISEFRPFYIVGEVEKPGSYSYTGGLTVLSAIAIAGGTTYRANQSKVLIQHVGDDKMHEYNMDEPIPILPGDIIQIPRRYI
jgi:polysaccharide export outer membrane protein